MTLTINGFEKTSCSACARLRGLAAGVCGAWFFLCLLVSPFTSLAAPAQGSPAWKITVVRIRSASTTIPDSLASKLQTRQLAPLMLEAEAGSHERASLLTVRVRNLSRRTRSLRWDVSRSPYLLLRRGATAPPIGHKFPGLSESSLAVSGILEVDIPPGSVYDLYPVFEGEHLMKAARLAIDSVGVVPMPHARRGPKR